MATALAAFVQDGTYTQEQVELIKQQVAKDATDMELALFLTVCKSTGLDPFRRQIYAIKRFQNGSMAMVIQTGIDGYRLLADRTGRYAPGQATTYTYAEDSTLYSATAYVRKYASGTWIEYSATALWSEYVQLKKDGGPTQMWQKMGHTMLGKCAEALALRRGFPGELSGLYVPEEMDQADNRVLPTPTVQIVEAIDTERQQALEELREAMREFKQGMGHSYVGITKADVDAATVARLKEWTTEVRPVIIEADKAA